MHRETSGDAWTSIGPEGMSVLSLAVDRSNPKTIYVGTEDSGIFKSKDGGASWAAVNDGFEGSNIILTLAIDPFKTNTVYAGTGNGLFKSTNGGKNWNAANLGVGKPNKFGVYSLAIDPRNTSTIYAASGSRGVFKSFDGGQTWSHLAGGVKIDFIALDPDDTELIYACSLAGGILTLRSR